MLDQISIVVITKNAADTLAATLDSTTGFAEVVVYDNGSNDATREIARSYDNVSLVEGDFFGFGPTKNHAISLASNDWVLSLDADEKLSPDLVNYLRKWQPASINSAGIIRRDNYMMGQLVDKGGWGADWLLRLFNRNTHQFDDKLAHERVPQTEISIAERIPYPIEHNAVRHLGEFLVKIDRYSEVHRETNNRVIHPALIFIRGMLAFVKSYVVKGGMFAGWRGLVIAWNDANGVFFKYMKIYADRHL